MQGARPASLVAELFGCCKHLFSRHLFLAGIEPATRGFSVLCYTNLATNSVAVGAFIKFRSQPGRAAIARCVCTSGIFQDAFSELYLR